MALTHAVLGLLCDGDHDAQSLTRALQRHLPTGPVNSGQLHAALREGCGRGWIAMRERSDVRGRVYEITAAGRQAFERWLAEPLHLPAPQRDDLLARLVFQAERDPLGLLKLLRARRRELVRQAMEAPLVGDPSDRARNLARDVIACRRDGELRAIERCLVTLEEWVHGQAVEERPRRVRRA